MQMTTLRNGGLKLLAWILMGVGVFTVGPSSAQSKEVVVLAGLGQFLFFNGYNVAVTYITDSGIVLDYSHGWLLQLDRVEASLTEEERDQELEILTTYTTGFGIGYLIGEELDVRIDFKEHAYRVYPPDDDQFEYLTWSVGPAVYYRVRLGDSGFLLEPSLRYWPNVASTLTDDKQTFLNANGEEEEHKAHDFGLFANVSLGFAF